ncbi:hypothetical protein DL240_13320 [Lujinxingia litoralis]|uniref:RNA polymerase subunit sigma-70 n=1 Tax=Lujinxingia litoralis TaxID=2211119 RepID=A0A328C5H1_9DELT|nr:sigma-70 family RNA polymerase sigma factor [Lujinxingia litoralis]RAL21825.1 hypothetical protein DL240_13320 [Lujinxingia litoralis]
MTHTSEATRTREENTPLPTNTRDLICRFQKLVFKIAHKVHQNTGGVLSMEDLVSWGYTGLLTAYKRFDPTINDRFVTFAYYRIRGAMYDACRQHAQVIGEQSTYEQAANEVMSAYAHVVHLSTQERSIEERLGMLGDIAGNLNVVYVLSQPPQQALRGQATPELSTLEHDQFVAGMRELVEGLNERTRALIEGYYFDQRTLSELSRELDCSVSWASRMHTRALRELREAIENDPHFEDLADAPCP